MEKVVFKKIYPKSETALAKCCSFKKGAGVDDVLANACRCFWCLNGHAPQGQACGREREARDLGVQTSPLLRVSNSAANCRIIRQGAKLCLNFVFLVLCASAGARGSAARRWPKSAGCGSFRANAPARAPPHSPIIRAPIQADAARGAGAAPTGFGIAQVQRRPTHAHQGRVVRQPLLKYL